ncbi:MAG: hypothetical protein M5R42_09610 [Rhodocyclaceae bacterium]|nr:hypothetical protein [Rhodocyclaceae bacterium]
MLDVLPHWAASGDPSARLRTLVELRITGTPGRRKPRSQLATLEARLPQLRGAHRSGRG